MRAPAVPLLVFLLLTATSATGRTASPEAGTPLGGACATSFDCTTASAPTCDGGTCVAGPALCLGDDSADAGLGDDGPAAATPIGAAPVAAAVCNLPATEVDFYKVTVVDRSFLKVTLDWAGAADLDLRVSNAAGRLVGESRHRNPEFIDLRLVPLDDYYIEVRRRAAAPIAAAVAYTLTAVTSDFNFFCKIASDCDGLWTSTALYRSVCLGLACTFNPEVGQPAGSPCDSDANCASGRCSYTVFESDVGPSVCTTTCTVDADCAGVPGAPICSSGRAPDICLPGCVADIECGTDPSTKSPDAGLPWDYYACTVAAQRCNAWIFKDGFEGGDGGLW